MSASERLTAWRREQVASRMRVGVAEEIGWLCGQVDADQAAARAAWAQANRLEFTVDRLEGERDAALAEVARLREALEIAVRLIPKSAERSEVDRLTRAIRVVVSSPVCHPHNAIVLRAALAEGSDVPGVVPACAGRSVVAHERTQMTPAPSGWRCPVCGETVALAEGSDVPVGRCGPCMIEDHGNCTRAKSVMGVTVFPVPGGFAVSCCCVSEDPAVAAAAEGSDVLPTQRDH